MGRRKRQVVPLSGDGRRLETLIDIILRCHPMSLRVLAGEYEPTTDELSEILACLSRGEIDVPRGVVRFFGSSEEEGRVIRAEVFEGVLGKVGGWSGLAAAAKRFAEAYPKTWAIVEDHVTWVALNAVVSNRLLRTLVQRTLNTSTSISDTPRAVISALISSSMDAISAASSSAICLSPFSSLTFAASSSCPIVIASLDFVPEGGTMGPPSGWCVSSCGAWRSRVAP